MNEIEHLHYSYNIDIYRSYSGHSKIRKGEIYFESNANDSLIGAKFYYTNNKYEGFYNGENIYLINKLDTSLIIKPLNDFEDGHCTTYPQLELSYCAIKLFLSDNNISNEIDSLIKRDTIIQSKKCTYYSFWSNQKFVSTVKNFDKHKQKVELIFQNSNHVPIYYSKKLMFTSGTRTHTKLYEARFNNYNFKTKYPDSVFEKKNIAQKYKIKAFKSLMINSKAPLWKLPLVSGDSISLADLRGKYVLLDFWFIGCGPCILSIKTLNKLQSSFKQTKLEIIGVNCLSNDLPKIKKYCSNQNMNYKNTWNGDSISKDYKIKAAPVFYLINPQGIIVYCQIGEDNEKLVRNITKLVK